MDPTTQRLDPATSLLDPTTHRVDPNTQRLDLTLMLFVFVSASLITRGLWVWHARIGKRFPLPAGRTQLLNARAGYSKLVCDERKDQKAMAHYAIAVSPLSKKETF